MKPTRIVFDAEPDDTGKLNPVNATVIRSRLAKWAGKHVTVIVQRYVKPKTGSQLGYYFGAIVPITAEHSGYTEDEMDTEFRRAFLPRVLKQSKITGVEELERIELRDLNAEQMSEFISSCLQECARQGIYMSSPEEYWKAGGL